MYEERRSRSAPVKEGAIVDVKIEADGAKGDGLAKVNGFVVFVKDAHKGEEIRVKITRVLKKYAFAERTDQDATESSDENYNESEDENLNEDLEEQDKEISDDDEEY
ncbi:TRAM domain-containing protein [Candidatus Woesearchaeota archaeon]|nr:TRAM domain-containing protein [Candidatus Woesearchaeota archaeon]